MACEQPFRVNNFSFAVHLHRRLHSQTPSELHPSNRYHCLDRSLPALQTQRFITAWTRLSSMAGEKHIITVFTVLEGIKQKIDIYDEGIFRVAYDFLNCGSGEKAWAPSCWSCQVSSNGILNDLEKSVWDLSWGQGQPLPSSSHVKCQAMCTDQANALTPILCLYLNSIKSY